MIAENREDESDPQLAERARTGDRAATTELVVRHSGLVYRIVGLARPPARVEFDDLIQEGMMALTNACSRWSPEVGSKFSTYCWIAVTNAIRDAIERDTNVPWQIDSRSSDEDDGPDGELANRSFFDRLPARDQPTPPEVCPLLALLTPLARSLVTQLFGLESNAVGWNDLAARHGLSVNQAKKLVRRALILIRSEAEKRGLDELGE